MALRQGQKFPRVLLAEQSIFMKLSLFPF